MMGNMEYSLYFNLWSHLNTKKLSLKFQLASYEPNVLVWSIPDTIFSYICICRVKIVGQS